MDLDSKIGSSLDTIIALNKGGSVLPAPGSGSVELVDNAGSSSAAGGSSGSGGSRGRARPQQTTGGAQPYIKRTTDSRRGGRGRGANSARGAPRGDEGGARTNALDSNGRRILSVAHTSNVKSVAGSIAHISRESEPPTLQAVGSMSTNQAIKAIAIARTFVENDAFDFLVEPARVPDETMKNLVQLRLEKRASRDVPDIDPVDLKIASTTDSGALAGAIANNIREGHRVRITAVGSVPVFRAVDSIIKARGFLTKDAVDLRFQPSFTTIEASDGNKINAIAFSILFHQV